jgi:hypothetical protein
MEELIKISEVLDGHRLRQIDIIGNEDSESRHSEFFRLLKDGNLKTDEAAAKYFFGEDASPKSIPYQQLKSSFRNRLINTLFFIDINHPSYNDFETANLTIQKEWAAINILFIKNDFRVATKLAEDLLPMALRYDLTELVIYITDRLKDIYGGQIGNVKKYTYYKRLQKEHMEIWQAEIQAKDLYQELRMHFIKSTAQKPFVSKIAQEGLVALEPALAKYASYRLIFFAYVSKVAQYTSINDFRRGTELCDEAIRVLAAKPYSAQRAISTFMNQKLMCLIRLKEYKEAHLIIEKTLKLQVEGSLSWFKMLEHAAALAFQTKNYNEAYVLYTLARSHSKFLNLEMRHLEIWHLYKAYLYFLASIGKIEKVTPKSDEFANFKLSRFLNDVNIFGRDSAGMKILVLIIEIALNLVDGHYGKMIDAVDAINRFRQRHLSKDHSLYRHNIMIKMIVEIPRAGFIKTDVRRKTAKNFKALQEIPVHLGEQGFGTEVIPFEEMWDFIVGMLNTVENDKPKVKPQKQVGRPKLIESDVPKPPKKIPANRTVKRIEMPKSKSKNK